MKSLFLSFVLIFNSIPKSYASSGMLEHEFRERWNYTPLATMKKGRSEFSIKQFKRTMWTTQQEIPLVDTTFTILKNPEEKTDLPKLAETMAKSFGDKSIKSFKNGAGYRVYGEFNKINRVIWIDLKLINNDFLMVSTMARKGTFPAVKGEVQELHKLLLTYNPQKEGVTSTFLKKLENLLIPKAYAQGGLLGSYLSNLLGGSNSTPQPSNPYSLTGGTQGVPSAGTSGSSLGSVIPSIPAIPTLPIGGSSNGGGIFSGTITIDSGTLPGSMTSMGTNVYNSSTNLVTASGNAQTAAGVLSTGANTAATTASQGAIAASVNVNTAAGTLSTGAQAAATTASQGAIAASVNINTAATTLSTGAQAAATTASQGAVQASANVQAAAGTLSTGAQAAATTASQGAVAATKNIDAAASKLGTSAVQSTENLREAAAQMSTTVNQQGARFNDNWAESNKLWSKMVDPHHMGKVAYWTAAGAALGGLTVNLAVAGISKGFAFLWELFTGEEKKKLEWADFEKAMAVWDTANNSIVKIEQALDEMLGAFEFFKEKGLAGTDYVKELMTSVREMEIFRRKNERFLDQNKDLDASCVDMYLAANYEIEEQIKKYQNILSFVKEKNLDVLSKEDFFCNQLADIIRNIEATENMLNKLRRNILVAEGQFYKKQKEAKEKGDEAVDKINSRLQKTLKAQSEYLKDSREGLKEQYQEAKDKWVTSCLEGQNEEGVEINKKFPSGMFRKMFSHFERKQLCEKKFDEVSDLAKAVDPALVELNTVEARVRKELNVKSNALIDANLSMRESSWMARVHLDAHCHQFGFKNHKDIPAECENKDGALYSMKLSQVHAKADKALEENGCYEKIKKSYENLTCQGGKGKNCLP